MSTRKLAPPPPECDRCGELCADDGRVQRSITGERLCRACAAEEEQDTIDAFDRGDEFTIGIGVEAEGDEP